MTSHLKTNRTILILFSICIVIAGVLTGCTSGNEPGFINVTSITLPDDLKSIVSENRRIALPPLDPDFEAKMERYRPKDLDAETDEAIAARLRTARTDGDNIVPYLSHEEIIDEIEYLFDLLKYGYAPYGHFGGDEVFGALKLVMLAKLSQMENPLETDVYMGELVAPFLNAVITDNHFSIYNESVGVNKRSYLYLNEETIFRKENGDYVTEIDGQAMRFVMNEDTAKYLLPTITREGELAWILGFHNTWGDGISRMGSGFGLEDVETGEYVRKHFWFFPVSSQYRRELSYEAYSVKEERGVTILENRGLYGEGSVMGGFERTGKDMKDKPVFILDLRSNGGGNDQHAMNWIQQYAGKSPVYGALFVHYRLHSKTGNALSQASSPHSPPSFGMFGHAEAPVIMNGGLVIVLTDNSISSSGESFVGFLRQLDNVLIVGTNTMGCLVSGNVGDSHLPNSKAWINFGTSFNVRPDFSKFEGVGFLPDLWVPPGESLERVLKFIERYGE